MDPRVARTRAAVLDAVRELVRTSGIEAVSHARVSQLAGVGRASVYRHWPDRTHLLLDAFGGRVDIANWRSSGSLRVDLETELDRLRQMLSASPLVAPLIALLGRAEWESELRELQVELLATGTAPLRAALQAAREREELQLEIELDDAVAMLAGPLFFQRVMAGRAITETFVAGVVDAFLAGHVGR